MGTGASSQYIKVTQHITDVVKIEEENIIFDWVVLDFNAWLMSQNYETKSSIFKAAQRLGRASYWYLKLTREAYDPEVITVGIYLHRADSALDQPKDICARVSLYLLDSNLKEARAFETGVKTFTSASVFGGPSLTPDSFDWRWNTAGIQGRSDLFSGNTLRIRLKMTLFGQPPSIMTVKDLCQCGSEITNLPNEEGEARTFPDLPVPIDTASLWTSKENADCVILCSGKSFLAHVNILARESLVLYSVFQNNLMQSSTGTSTANQVMSKIVLNVDDMEPEILEATLKFIYKGNLDDLPGSDGDWKNELAAGLLKTAKRFGLMKLQKHCLSKLATGLSLENAGRSAILAHEYYASLPVVNQIHRFIRRNKSELDQIVDFSQLVSECPAAFPCD